MDVKIDDSWKNILKDEFEKEYFKELVAFVRNEYRNKVVYPPGSEIFNAFNLCSFDKVKVVIIGQDPYHGKGQANGLSFSVKDSMPIPPSLINIYKELHNDLGIEIPKTGNLEMWAKQGVLLLNSTLTVIANIANSHQGKGWDIFTDSVIEKISENKENIVFILWGAFAKKKSELIDTTKHFIISSAHPSPFAADKGFFGSKPFSKTNNYLKSKNIEPINW